VLPTLAQIEAASRTVYTTAGPTPQLTWPLLSFRCGHEVWVKHENHLPTGAFKIRGGLVYLDELAKRGAPAGVIAATRGNHGQSVAFAAQRSDLEATIVVPKGNSRAKNLAMRSFGAQLIERGRDFQDALEYAQQLAQERELHMIPSFHPTLLRGVASYALELFRGAPPLRTVYVPIGLGSGICGTIAARDALGLRTAVVGVVAENAPAYQLSLERGEPVPTEPPETMADGLAVRVPHPEAFAIIRAGVDHIVAVSEEEIRDAVRVYFDDTHNVAEGAGAAPLAALMKERGRHWGHRAGVVLSGGNIDRATFAAILAERAD